MKKNLLNKRFVLSVVAVLFVCFAEGQTVEFYPLQKEREYVKINYLQDAELAKSIGLPKTYTGKGVLVATIDLPVVYDHIAFRDPVTKKTRVKYMYDSTTDKIYTPETFSEITYNTRHHGTHVMGVAAGGYDDGEGLAGIATSSDLVSFYDREYHIPVSLAKIKHIADSLDVPCVVNISQNIENLSQYEPNDTIYNMFRAFTDDGKAPGRIICVSSGNDGGYETQRGITHTFTSDTDTLKILGKAFNKYYGDSFYALCTDLASTKVSFDIYDTKKKCISKDPVTFVIQSSEADTLTNASQLERFLRNEKDVYGRDFYIYKSPLMSCNTKNLAISYSFVGKKGETITLEMEAQESNLPDGYTSYNTTFPHNHLDRMAASPYSISVGAVISKDCYDPTAYEDVREGEIWESSGWGKNFAGEVYPDVCAPGVDIWSAGPLDYGEYRHIITDPDNPDLSFNYCAMTGTSMACPFVTGVAALLLEQDPTLNVERFKKLLHKSNDWTDACENEYGKRGGHGILNAKNLMLALLGETTGIQEVKPAQTESSAAYDITGRRINSKSYKGIMIVDGKKLHFEVGIKNYPGLCYRRDNSSREFLDKDGSHKGPKETKRQRDTLFSHTIA